MRKDAATLGLVFVRANYLHRRLRLLAMTRILRTGGISACHNRRLACTGKLNESLVFGDTAVSRLITVQKLRTMDGRWVFLFVV